MVYGSWAFKFCKKLQFLKGKIKEWNRVKFGNIFVNKNEIEAELEDLQLIIMGQWKPLTRKISSSLNTMKFWLEKRCNGNKSLEKVG